MRALFLLGITFFVSATGSAHDTWVETNTTSVPSGQAVYVDLKLGNHGNHHRDFKLASKIALTHVTLHTVGPDGKAHDLKPALVDTGYAPKEGYWTAKAVTPEPGLYVVAHTLNTLHLTTRAIKSAKTYYYVAPTSAGSSSSVEGFDKPLGHEIELVPLTDPLVLAGPGKPLDVKLLFKGKPLAEATISFIPRGQALTEEFDARFERKTDSNGVASFTPESGNRYLAVVHHAAPDEKGEGFDRTAYSATLTFLVPEVALTVGK